MLQLVYVSSARPGLSPADPEAILAVSRANNARDAITGFLYSDGRRFLQALEGPADKVAATIERIRTDPRHRAIVILSSREVAEREFGDWAMAHYEPGADADAFIARIGERMAAAAPNIRATFEGFAQARKSSLR
ncbi:MAG: BLUF domain-containing protein [Pseudomonadota bacterium]